MSHNIIIITRDTDPNYSDPNNPLGKMIVEGRGVPITMKDSYLAAFQYLSKYKLPEYNGGYSTARIAEEYDVDVDVKWLNGEISDLMISDDMVNLLDKVRNTLDDEQLFEKIKMDNGDLVYLLYWNLMAENEFNVWQCLPLICKDCKIETNINATIQEIPDRHILYIHDDEWGKEGNWLLMKNSEPKEGVGILNSLKNCFQYIATFQHTNIDGYYFNNILNCRFGEDSIADKLGELEENKSFTDFIQLKQEMIKKLQEWK